MKEGIYRHYKGRLYEVIGSARHSETLEVMVVYRALYDSEEFGSKALWVRPESLFSGSVRDGEGSEVPRFRYVGKQVS
jgi:hypothetical protein